ncbi:hypothetical protein BJ085DRAFT_6910, partial [Dimargaris cristalligena]
CAQCAQPIAPGTAVIALNRHWHADHLRCAACQKPLAHSPPHDRREHQGRVYCSNDYNRMFLPQCQGCRQPILEEDPAISNNPNSATGACGPRSPLFALNAKWHYECFNCQVCHQAFPDKSFYVFENKPHCRYHYHQLNKSLCQRCQQPIEGPCAQVLEGRFHPACFTCDACRVPFRDIYYNIEGTFYCEQHLTLAQNPNRTKADRRRTLF